ncbi:hypothetical protein EDB86DRAFT_1100793 [Lactarius hatsudake]|nr:hypothetical protein EDB86DRAFT_1100793 [Lactarius hatsudake]
MLPGEPIQSQPYAVIGSRRAYRIGSSCNLPWDDMRVKHTWSTVQLESNWETLGIPSAGATIDLYIVLGPHQENALIDALYEISDQGTVTSTSQLLRLRLHSRAGTDTTEAPRRSVIQVTAPSMGCRLRRTSRRIEDPPVLATPQKSSFERLVTSLSWIRRVRMPVGPHQNIVLFQLPFEGSPNAAARGCIPC